MKISYLTWILLILAFPWHAGLGSLPRNSNLKADGDISLPLTRKRLINNPFALSFLVLAADSWFFFFFFFSQY